MTPVLAAGVGVRHGRGWALRSASFRLESPVSGRTAFGIVIADQLSATALIDVLAGLIRPSYGELRVLGQDMTPGRGRSAVHQPGLLLLDGLLDDLDPRDVTPLADAIRDLGRDTTVVAIGQDPQALGLACGEVLTMADGILVRP